MRINQFLAKHLGISRRSADEVVKAGEVRINGQAAELHNHVEAADKVEVMRKGKWETFDLQEEDSQVLLMYKPIFTVTTHDDPEKRRTVFDVLPPRFKNYKTAGRLDYMSEGLLILSTNGHLILSLTHPKFKTQKVYLVGLKKPLTNEQISKAAGKEIEIEGYLLNPVQINRADLGRFGFLKPEPGYHWYEFTLSEGRNQQIRKMARYFGNEVKRLVRVQHGRFSLTPELKQKGWQLVNSTGNEA